MKSLDAYNAVRPAVGAREQEAIALRLASRKLRDAGDRPSRAKALRLNHELWTLLIRDLAGENNKLPPILKRDCLALAVFSLDYSTRAVVSELSLTPLIEVNERVAEGLEGGARAPAVIASASAAPPPSRAPSPVLISA